VSKTAQVEVNSGRVYAPDGRQRGPEEPPGAHRRVQRPGKAVQVDPIKYTLKALGAKRLKLKHDNPQSNFGFNLNLRRYAPGSPLFVFLLSTRAGGQAGG